MSVKVQADLTVCQGYANCVVTDPEVFDLDDETGKVTVLMEDVSGRPEVRVAVDSCPVGALSLVEEP